MFWELNLRPKRQLRNRNFWSYHVGYHVCGALTIEMSGTTCWNEIPKTFIASEKKSAKNHHNRVLSVLESIWAQKALLIDNGNVLGLKIKFWEVNLRPKRRLLNRNFWSYHVGYIFCGALTIEMSGTTCWNEKPKTFFAKEKKMSLESSKSRFKRSRSDLSAKKLSKSKTATFWSLNWYFER